MWITSNQNQNSYPKTITCMKTGVHRLCCGCYWNITGSLSNFKCFGGLSLLHFHVHNIGDFSFANPCIHYHCIMIIITYSYVCLQHQWLHIEDLGQRGYNFHLCNNNIEYVCTLQKSEDNLNLYRQVYQIRCVYHIFTLMMLYVISLSPGACL